MPHLGSVAAAARRAGSMGHVRGPAAHPLRARVERRRPRRVRRLLRRGRGAGSRASATPASPPAGRRSATRSPWRWRPCRTWRSPSSPWATPATGASGPSGGWRARASPSAGARRVAALGGVGVPHQQRGVPRGAPITGARRSPAERGGGTGDDRGAVCRRARSIPQGGHGPRSRRSRWTGLWRAGSRKGPTPRPFIFHTAAFRKWAGWEGSPEARVRAPPAAASLRTRGDVAKWLTRRSAKPLFAGSTPAVASLILPSGRLRQAPGRGEHPRPLASMLTTVQPSAAARSSGAAAGRRCRRSGGRRKLEHDREKQRKRRWRGRCCWQLQHVIASSPEG